MAPGKISVFIGASVALAALVVAANVSTVQAQAPLPVVAAGYTLEQNCPTITAASIAALGANPGWNLGHMALNPSKDKLYIVYTPFAAGPGQVHVRDLNRCTQKVFANVDGPLGIAVNPYNGNIYVTHRYLNPDFDGIDLKKKYRGAISIYNRQGQLIADKWVKGFAPSLCCGPATPEYGNGAQGMSFDHAGNLYLTMNLDVHETTSYPGFYASGFLYKIEPDGDVSVFASGIRAAFDAVIAEENWRGEATAFYLGDNGEGDACTQAGPGCANRVVAGSTPSHAMSRMYYDELNYVVKDAHYGYPESMPTGMLPFSAADHVSHPGPLWNFEKVMSTAFTPFPLPLNPVPTGITLIEGQWGKVTDPLFLGFWSGQRVDMFTGPNRSKRITLVGNLLGRVGDVVNDGERVIFGEEATRLIYTVRPARH